MDGKRGSAVLNEFFVCKTEQGDDAVASLTDDTMTDKPSRRRKYRQVIWASYLQNAVLV